MKLQLEATPEELATKGEALIKALAARIEPHDAALAENLEKALRREPGLRYRSLDLIADVERALLGEETRALRKAQTKTTEVDNDPDYDPESGEPIFDPKTGLSPSEEAEDREKNPENYEEEEDEAEKSVSSLHDHNHGVPLPSRNLNGEDADDEEDEEAEEEDEAAEEALKALAHPVFLVDSTGKMPVEFFPSPLTGDAEGLPMPTKSSLTKAGPYMGPRGGLWADPEHTIHWDEKTHGRVTKKRLKELHDERYDKVERVEGEALVELLQELGDRLYEIQEADPMSRDASGLSGHDMQRWREVRGDVLRMKRLLKKYKRQLHGESYFAAGLADPISDQSIEWKIHPRFGSLNITLSGYVKEKALWWEVHNFHKELGMWKDRGTGAYVLRNPEGFDFEAYRKRLTELLPGVQIPKETPRIKTEAEKKAEKKQAQAKLKEELAAAGNPVDMLWDGLRDGSITNGVGVRWHKDANTFEFRFPRGKVSTLFSNKRGGLPTVTKWDQSTQPWGVHVFDVDTAQLAVKMITDMHPDWEVATDGLEDAIAQRDAQRSKNELPIPALTAKLAEGYQLFPYQNEGVRFLLDSIDPDKEGGAMLGDEMGLGKTLQMLSYAVIRKQRMVVIAPKTVRRTWLQEADKFYPDSFVGKELDSAELLKAKRNLPKLRKQYLERLRVSGDDGNESDLKLYDLYSSNPKMLEDPRVDAQLLAESLGLDKANLATINYESLGKFRPLLAAVGFDVMVMDESHRMKNPKAKLTQEINALGKSIKTKILLSGTAIKNKKEEFATQFEIIRPGLFKKVEKYNPYSRKMYTVSEIKGETIGGLWDRMRPFYLARQKDMVLDHLPPKTLRVAAHKVATAPDLPNNAKAIVNNARYFAYAQAITAGEDEGAAKGRGDAAAEAMELAIVNLREEYDRGEVMSAEEETGGRRKSWGEVLRSFGLSQLTSGEQVVGAYSKIKAALAVAKTDVTRQIADEILEGSDSNILIFTNSKAAVRRLKALYGDNAVTHYGDDSHEKREKAKALFHPDTRPEGDDVPRILIGTMDTLKEGATLTSADKVIFNDLPWTAAEFRQAEARAHRPGQDKSVDVIWSLAEGNDMDLAISTLLRRKIDLTRKHNEGRRTSAEEQKAIDTDIQLDTILAELRGDTKLPEPETERKKVKGRTTTRVKPAKAEPVAPKGPDEKQVKVTYEGKTRFEIHLADGSRKVAWAESEEEALARIEAKGFEVASIAPSKMALIDEPRREPVKRPPKAPKRTPVKKTKTVKTAQKKGSAKGKQGPKSLKRQLMLFKARAALTSS
jgi:hypothetical protein